MSVARSLKYSAADYSLARIERFDWYPRSFVDYRCAWMVGARAERNAEDCTDTVAGQDTAMRRKTGAVVVDTGRELHRLAAAVQLQTAHRLADPGRRPAHIVHHVPNLASALQLAHSRHIAPVALAGLANTGSPASFPSFDTTS